MGPPFFSGSSLHIEYTTVLYDKQTHAAIVMSCTISIHTPLVSTIRKSVYHLQCSCIKFHLPSYSNKRVFAVFVRRLSATAIQRTVDGKSSGSSGPIIYMHGKLSNGMVVGSYSLHTLAVKAYRGLNSLLQQEPHSSHRKLQQSLIYYPSHR